MILFLYFFFQVIATLTFFVKQTKKTKKSKHLLTVFELISYVKDKALLIIGKASHKSTDHHVHANVSSL